MDPSHNQNILPKNENNCLTINSSGLENQEKMNYINPDKLTNDIKMQSCRHVLKLINKSDLSMKRVLETTSGTSEFMLPISQFVGTLALCAVLIFQTRFKDPNSPSDFGTHLGSIYLFTRYIIALSNSLASFTKFRSLQPYMRQVYWNWRRLERYWNSIPITNTRNENWEARSAPAVIWKEVSFKYPHRANLAIDKISFYAPSGSFTAFVGDSGKGKSTALGLQLMAYLPTSGSITLQFTEKNSEQVVTRSLEDAGSGFLENCAYIGPEAYIIEGTILDNLTFALGRTPAESEIIQCLKKTHCDFVFSLPGGLNYKIDALEKGLSNGEKQRLNWARALLRKPKVLILDEPTNFLDERQEKALMDTLVEMKGKVTILGGFHRSNLLLLADQKIYL